MKFFTTFANKTHNSLLNLPGNAKTLTGSAVKYLSNGIKFKPMKKYLSLSAIFAVSCLAASSASASEVIPGVFAVSVSHNGQWLLGQAEGEGVLFIKDFSTGKVYNTGGATSDAGNGFVAGMCEAIADDGTSIALIDGLPYWWSPSANTWTRLPGQTQDGSAALGSITADGSMIVGGLGTSGLTTEDVQMTFPCIWYRQPDGTYGEPVFLPNPDKDRYGFVPQYVNCLAVSDDGNVIAAMMTENSGFFDLPYIYTRNEQGEWSYREVGSAVIDAENSGDFSSVPGTGRADGYSFLSNNARVSPDGKYVYATLDKTYVIDPMDPETGIITRGAPVRFNVAEGSFTDFDNDGNLVLTDVAADYSILCRVKGLDDYWPTEGWIFPKGETRGLPLPEYIKGFGSNAAYTWMESNMYRECIVGISGNGAYIFDDAWTVGIPVCSDNLEILACGDYTMYWADSKYDAYSMVTFVVNTREGSSDNAVGSVTQDSLVSLLPGGAFEIKGEAADVTVYDLAGNALWSAVNVSGEIRPNLAKGIYLLHVATPSATSTIKVAL